MDFFVPDIYQKSIFAIDYEKLAASGIKCILFDLDNTICPIALKNIDKKTKNLFEEIKEIGIKPIIFSNNHRQRIAPFKDALNVDASALSRKPFKFKYKKVLKLYGYKIHEVAAVGDQLLTDILGANRMGITSIMVNPISDIDSTVTKFNRWIEKIIFKYLAKKGLFEVGEYYD